MSIEQEIEQEHNEIRNEGERLHLLKSHYLQKNEDIPDVFDYQMLRLIRKIITHDQKYKNNLTSTQRRADLGNVVNSVLLINTRIKNPYNNRDTNYANNNIWRDINLLQKFDLPIHGPTSRSIYTISDNQVNQLLDGDIANHFYNIVVCEAFALKQEQKRTERTETGSLFTGEDWINKRGQIRDKYSNHLLLRDLSSFTTYNRECEQFQKAIKAVNYIQNAPLTPPNLPVDITMARKATLRCIVTIGEAVTKKNLTSQTANLVFWEFISNGLKQILITLANKITHNEWDIHRLRLEHCLKTFNFIQLQQAMPYLRDIFTLMLEQLRQMYQAGTINAHYLNNSIIPLGAMSPPPLVFENLRNQITGNENSYRQDKVNHPDSFTGHAMYARIKQEVEELDVIFNNLEGHESLDQNFLFDQLTAIGAPNASLILHRIAIIAQENQQVTQAINSINQYYNRINAKVIFEVTPSLVGVQLDIVGRGAERYLDLQQLYKSIFQHFQDYIQAIIEQGRRCQLYISLLNNENALHAAYYHLGRVAKFLDEIRHEDLLRSLSPTILEELTTFRNYIRHGSDALETSTIEDYQLLVRYTGLITRHVLNHLWPILADEALPQPGYNL